MKIFAFRAWPVKVRWRPSGEETPQAEELPLCSHKGNALPSKSTYNRTDPRCTMPEVKNPPPLIAQFKFARVFQPLTVKLRGASPCKEIISSRGSKSLPMAMRLPSGEMSHSYQEVGSISYRASSRPRPLSGSRAVKIICLLSALCSQNTHKVAGDFG